MKKGELIFVYGTLRRGERADLSKNAYEFGTSYIGQDYVNGLLYHLGSYPGAKLSPISPLFEPDKPVILGDVFRILDTSIGILLDAYECYPSLYDRIQVVTEKDRRVWIYTYNHEVADGQLIDSGDWQNQIIKPLSQDKIRIFS